MLRYDHRFFPSAHLSHLSCTSMAASSSAHRHHVILPSPNRCNPPFSKQLLDCTLLPPQTRSKHKREADPVNGHLCPCCLHQRDPLDNADTNSSITFLGSLLACYGCCLSFVRTFCTIANPTKKRHHVGITNLTSFHFGGPWQPPHPSVDMDRACAVRGENPMEVYLFFYLTFLSCKAL